MFQGTLRLIDMSEELVFYKSLFTSGEFSRRVKGVLKKTTNLSKGAYFEHADKDPYSPANAIINLSLWNRCDVCRKC